MDEEFIAPTVESLEALGIIHVVYQNTTIRTPVECNT